MRIVREGRLRKLHRCEWSGFLNRLVPPSLGPSFLGQMPRSSDAQTRGSPTSALLWWVMLGWSLQTQLARRFQEARQTLTRAYSRRRRCGGTHQAWLQATRRFGPDLFTRFWASLRLRDSFGRSSKRCDMTNRVERCCGDSATGFKWRTRDTRRNEPGTGLTRKTTPHPDPQTWADPADAKNARFTAFGPPTGGP